MAKPKQSPGEPMTLGNMRQLGVQRLVATCLNDACRHQGLVDVSTYPADTEVPWFANKVVCAEMRSAWSPYRRAAELERATRAAEPDGQAMAVTGAYP
jgi:hypothetical protein